MDNSTPTSHSQPVNQTETTRRAQERNPLDFTKAFPEELVTAIFSCLDISDLSRASMINREWNRFANDNILWKKFYFAMERFSTINFAMPSYKNTVKVIYLLTLEKAKQIPSIPQKLIEGPKSTRHYRQLQDKFILHEGCKQLAGYIKLLPNAAPQRIADKIKAVEKDITTDKTFTDLMGWINVQDIKQVWQRVAEETSLHMEINESGLDICDWKGFNTAFAEWMERHIEKVGNLQVLDLSFCHLAYLPDCLEKLSNLKSLLLNDNELTELPESFGSLRQLTKLNLERNYLADIPKRLANHPNLESLSIGQNKLRALPDFIKDLKNLRVLSIDFSLLDSFSFSPKNLETLEVIIKRDELYLFELFQPPEGNYTVKPLVI